MPVGIVRNAVWDRQSSIERDQHCSECPVLHSRSTLPATSIHRYHTYARYCYSGVIVKLPRDICDNASCFCSTTFLLRINILLWVTIVVKLASVTAPQSKLGNVTLFLHSFGFDLKLRQMEDSSLKPTTFRLLVVPSMKYMGIMYVISIVKA